MKSFQLIGLRTSVSCFAIGCGGSGTTAPVADQGELSAFVSENPDAGADLEPDEGVGEE